MQLENADIRVTVLLEGGHIAEFLDKATGISPLWIPSWASVEPSTFGPAHHAQFGSGSDGKLLAGIMGHNLCLDIFGGPSADEAAAGMTAHGEGSVAPYHLQSSGSTLRMSATFPLAAIRFDREITLDGDRALIRERVANQGGCDRPIGWTQHVTLGAPFLEVGKTELRASTTKSLVYDGTFGVGDYLQPGAGFDWPLAPRSDGGTSDRRRYTNMPSSSAYTAHLMDPQREDAEFVTWSPSAGLAFGCAWQRNDFPWLGIWEENRSRTAPPWNGGEVTWGMEFGVSPIPESRRQMVERGSLFDVPTFRWLPAGGTLTAAYTARAFRASHPPERVISPQ